MRKELSYNSADRKTLTYGHGAYEQEYIDRTPAHVEHARNDFLNTVAKLMPEVLSELAEEPFNLYRRTPAICYAADKERLKKYKQHNVFDQVRDDVEWKQQRPAWRDIENPWRDPLLDAPFADEKDSDHPVHHAIVCKQLGREIADPTPSDDDGSIAAFKASLFDWSRRHNLDELWCRERAYETLDLWSRLPGCREACIWQPEFAWRPIMLVGYRGAPPNFDFVFRHETHYPREGFRQQVKQRILEACEKQIDTFLDERERQAEEGGMVPTPRKRESKHFEWLAYYQIKVWSFGRIAKTFNASRKTVEDGVKSAVKLCGMDLRLRSRPGRPRKQ